MVNNAPKIVSSAILGLDVATCIIGGKVYVINPPTIHKIAGAAYYLSEVKDGSTLKDIIKSLGDMSKAAHALSWLIEGNDSLYSELAKGTSDEVVDALDTALSLISARNFLKLSILAKNVQKTTANQRR